MKQKKHFSPLIAAALVVMFIAPLSAEASIVYRSGETVSLESDQNVDGDFYVTAGSASLSGSVDGDLYAAAGSMTINGSIAEDLLAIGGTVQMHAAVEDDVRVIAGEVTIAEAVKGDLLVIAGVVNVLSTASIEGDVLLLGGEAELSGPIGGSVMGASDRLRIDAPVGGDVDVRVTELVLGDRAAIGGDIRFVSPRELVRSPNAVIEGEVLKNTVVETVSTREIIQSLLIPLFILLFAALTLFLFFREPVTIVATVSRNNFWLKSLIGLAILLGTPILFGLLFATVIGALVGLFILSTWIGLILLSVALLPIVVGQWITYLTTKKLSVTILSIAFGALAIEVVLFVPFIGVLAVLIFLTAIMGTLLQLAYRALG